MNEAYFDDRLHKALKDATWAIQDYLENYHKENDYLDRLKFILFAVISSVVDISEAHGDCSSEYIWSELENIAKEGGLIAVAEKIKSERTYSISGIDPQDIGSGMNYLGQRVSTALYKHIHDLPIQQRQPGMFLRALETVIANLLNQKFAECDQHKLVDSLCEHLHMALDDKGSWDSENKQKSTLKMVAPYKVEPQTAQKLKTSKSYLNIRRVVIKMDHQALKILAHGGQAALIDALPEFIVDLGKIERHKNKDELDDLCNEYDGFYQLILLIETLADGISTGKIKVK